MFTELLHHEGDGINRVLPVVEEHYLSLLIQARITDSLLGGRGARR